MDKEFLDQDVDPADIDNVFLDPYQFFGPIKKVKSSANGKDTNQKKRSSSTIRRKTKDRHIPSVTEELEKIMMLSAVSIYHDVPPSTVIVTNYPLQVSNPAHSQNSVSSNLTPEEISLQDDFTSNTINEDHWTVKLSKRNNSAVTAENGMLKISGRSLLVTKDEFIPSTENQVVIEGEWTPVAEGMESLYVNTRSSGEVDSIWGNASDGMQFVANNIGTLSITDLSLNKVIAITKVDLKLGETYSFRIEDNGSHLYFRMKDSTGRLVGGVAVESATQSDKGFITFSDSGGNGHSAYEKIAIAGKVKVVVVDTNEDFSDPDTVEQTLNTEEPSSDKAPSSVVLLQEDFNGDLSQWTVDESGDGADVHIANGMLISANSGTVVTKEDFRGTAETPITVSGLWRPVRDNASNTHSMTLHLRSNGNADGYSSGNGVYLVAYTNNDIFIGQWKDGEHTKLAQDSSRALKLGETYRFSVTDNGSNITVFIRDKEGNEIIHLEGISDDSIGNGGKVVIQSRQNGMSKFDDIQISKNTLVGNGQNTESGTVEGQNSKGLGDGVLLKDDFSSDLSQWNVDESEGGADIHIDNGKLISANLGTVTTKEDFRGTQDVPISVSGVWTPVRDDLSNTHSMTLRLRNNGDLNNNSHQNDVYLVAYTNNDVFIGQWKDGVHTKLAEDSSKALKLGETYYFTVTDNGSTVTVVITDEAGNEKISLTGQTSDDIRSGDRIVLQSRQRGMSRFDDLQISTVGSADSNAVDDETSSPTTETAPPITGEDNSVTQTPSVDPQPTLAELQEKIIQLKSAIMERGMSAKILEQSILETFDEWDSNTMATIQGNSSISNGALNLGGNAVVQMIQVPVRQSGQEKITTIHVMIGSNDRFMWRSGATQENEFAGEAVDILTQKYIGITGAHGDRHLSNSVVNGLFTIVEVENDQGITVTITDPRGQSYSFSYGLPEAGSEAQPAFYGWKNCSIQDVTFDLYSSETLIEALGEAQVNLWKLDPQSAREQTVMPTVQAGDTPEQRKQSFQEKKEYLQNNINDLTLWYLAVKKSGGSEREMSDIQERIKIQEQQKVPYSAMYVSPDPLHKNVSVVQYMSNNTQTYFEVRMDGQPGMVYRRTIEHPAGEQNGVTEFNIGQVYNGVNGYGNKFDIYMYSDESKTVLLDSIHGHYTNGVAVAQTNGVWSDLDTGRTVENPVVPMLSIEKISGPNILVSYQSPHNSTELALEGGGYFNTNTKSHEGGASLGTAMLTFSADNPSGNYRLQMIEGRNRHVVDEMTLTWDADTKSLTRLSDNTEIAVDADSEEHRMLTEISQLFDRRTSIETLSTSFSQVSDIFARHLYDESSFVVDNDKAQWYVDQYWTGHPLDGYGEFIKLLDAYEKETSALLRGAAQIAVNAFNGLSQKEAYELLQESQAEASTHRYIREIGQFHIELPSAEELRDEGIRLMISDYGVNMAMHMHDQDDARLARDNYLANHSGEDDDPSPGGGDGGTGGAENTDDSEGGTVVLSETAIEEGVYQSIQDRVAARLEERLASMTIQERAEARGLIRLKEEGKLDEYLSNNQTATDIISDLETNITQIQEDTQGILSMLKEPISYIWSRWNTPLPLREEMADSFAETVDFIDALLHSAQYRMDSDNIGLVETQSIQTQMAVLVLLRLVATNFQFIAEESTVGDVVLTAVSPPKNVVDFIAITELKSILRQDEWQELAEKVFAETGKWINDITQ